jgi:Mn-containing catalase
VDKKGKIAYSRLYEPTTQPDINEAIEILKKIK